MKVLLSPGQWGCEICGPADLAGMRPVVAKLEHCSFETAQLMARAPELLEALKRIADMKNQNGDLVEMHPEELRAIAKAAL